MMSNPFQYQRSGLLDPSDQETERTVERRLDNRRQACVSSCVLLFLLVQVLFTAYLCIITTTFYHDFPQQFDSFETKLFATVEHWFNFF